MQAGVVLGVDIGGTNTAFGFVAQSGKLLAASAIPTNAHLPAEELFGRLFAAAKELFAPLAAHYTWLGTGIGAPNANYYTGTVEQPPNLSWGSVNLVRLAALHTPLPCAITNDANAAALGEMLFGAAAGMKNFIMITLGTGLGSGVVVNGKLVYGHDGFAGEIGHCIVKENGRQCGCGRRGCLETYASAPGICRTVQELLADMAAESPLRAVPPSELTARTIYDFARKGDAVALEAFRVTGEILGKALANTMVYTSPEAFILFGGLASAWDLLYPATYPVMEANMLNIFKNKVKLLPSLLTGGDTAVLGAAALMWAELQS